MLAALCLSLAATIGEGDPGDLFGSVIATAGDLDGDGVLDLLIADPIDADRSIRAGRVWAVSGKTFAVLRTWVGERDEQLGSTLAPVGDLDRDGLPDVMIGTANVRERATARFVSGKSGATIYAIPCCAHQDPCEADGPVVVSLGDVDRDGIPDLALGSALGFRGEIGDSPNPRCSTFRRVERGGRVALHSGADGHELWNVVEPDDDLWFGCSLAATGDVDGDGIPDVAAAARPAWKRAGYVRILSVRDGTTIRTLRGLDGSQRFSQCIASGFDLDRDAVFDVVAVQDGSPRRALAFSGKTGELLRTWDLPERAMYSAKAALIHDRNADGVPELLLCAPGSESEIVSFQVVSGASSNVLFEVERCFLDGRGFGCSAVELSDLDGDGVTELAIGEATRRDHDWQGEVDIFNGKSGALVATLTRAKLIGALKAANSANDACHH